MAKALYWAITDTQRRKLGEQMGLDTPVVLAVNDGYSMLDVSTRSELTGARTSGGGCGLIRCNAKNLTR
eukprot:2960334-Prymnesium_polylepis.1